MLTFLSIKNFALIEKLAIDFTVGFSTITGETGAGKSILLGALGLVLGKRADLSSLKNKEEKCVVEAHFKISSYDLKEFFVANDLDYDPVTILRREILPSGKSRAFINDSPVNLQELQDLGQFLIDIHSQHQTQELSEEKIQFGIIDAIAQNQALAAEFSTLLKTFRHNKNILDGLYLAVKESGKEQEYNTFLLEELLAAKLVPGSQEALESTFEQLNNAEYIKEIVAKSLTLSENEQYGILQNIGEVRNLLHRIASISPYLRSLSERLDSAAIEFNDIVAEMNRFSENITDDPVQLDHVNSQLQTIYGLQKKHQVSTIEELLRIMSELEEKTAALGNLDNEISDLESKILQDQAILEEKAKNIRENRRKAIPVLSEKLIGILSGLGMPNVRFNIELLPAADYNHRGKDDLRFMFSANKGSDFGLLKKVASGGEMSRIMLAVKAILSHYSSLPTIIFDEIDTGVSGEIANKMGEIMQQMGEGMQVFAITHLPQIAAKGAAHYKVFKSVIGGQTHSELKLLSQEERIVEIAEMLSGKNISDTAIIHAKALLN